MTSSNRTSPGGHVGRRHWGRAQQDAISDPYKADGKFAEPTVCPQCGAVYQDGRWKWSELPASGEKRLCQACHRINDHFPAGIVTLSGAFPMQHKEDVLSLVRHQEEIEKSEHAQNRIMNIDEMPDRIVINTTDIHLPRRIGEACKRAFKGELKLQYDEDAYFVRVDWRRDLT